jgi:hypothetical protein
MNQPMQGSVLRMASSDMWRIKRSICGIEDGAEEVGNLHSSIRRDGRNLNVLRRWRIKHALLFHTTLELLVISEDEIGLSIYFVGASGVAYRQAYRRQTVVKIYPGAFWYTWFPLTMINQFVLQHNIKEKVNTFLPVWNMNFPFYKMSMTKKLNYNCRE